MSSAYPNDGVNPPSSNGASNTALPGATTPLQIEPPATPPPDAPKPLTPAELAQQQQTRQAIIVASIVGIIMLVLLIGFIIFLAVDPARTALIRDIVIVLTAIAMTLMTVVIGILMVVLIYRLQELIGFLRGELLPMIEKISFSVNQVTGTANIVSDNVARPTIKFVSVMAGLQQMAKAANAKVRGER